MALNRFMLAALRALSSRDVDVKQSYKRERQMKVFLHPVIKPLHKIFDTHLSVENREIPIRIFLPQYEESREVILFFHGGGWVTGNIESYTKTCATLADRTLRRVVCVDYRLAPEHPFPCGLEDCYLVAKKICLDFEFFGVKQEQVILMGDSAGGNLAACVSILAVQRKEFSISRQVLLYPVTHFDHGSSSPFLSVHENGTDYILTAKQVEGYTQLYCKPEEQQNPLVSPLLAEDLKNQPKTLVITAQYDPLRDEGEAYGEKLKSFGNVVAIHRMEDVVHGFFSLPLRFKRVRECFALIEEFLQGE